MLSMRVQSCGRWQSCRGGMGDEMNLRRFININKRWTAT